MPLYPSVAFRVWQVPVCAVALVYTFDVLLAVFVVWLAERVLDIDIQLADDMELGDCVEVKVDREADAGFDIELGMAFVEPEKDPSVELAVIVTPAFPEGANPIEAPTPAVDAGFIEKPIPRLETALFPKAFGTQHSERSEKRNFNRFAKLTSVPSPTGHHPGTKKPPLQPFAVFTHMPWPFGELHAP